MIIFIHTQRRQSLLFSYGELKEITWQLQILLVFQINKGSGVIMQAIKCMKTEN